MKLKSGWLLALLLVCSCSNTIGPIAVYQKVLPGDPVLNPSRITPHTIRYQKVGNSMEYEVNNVVYNGRQALEFNVYFGGKSPTNSTPDRMYADIETLAYRGRLLTLKDYIIDVKVNDQHFTGSLTPQGDGGYTPVVYNKRYPHDGFEPAIINYFIAALPLKVGYKASIPVFDLNKGSQMLWSNIEVLDKEIIELNDKQYETWKVVSDGIKKKTLWISTTLPYAIRMETDGSFGAWELVE